MLLLCFLFSLHTECLVCCAYAAYKEAGGSRAAPLIISSHWRGAVGWASPHKGTCLLQTFTYCIVAQVLKSIIAAVTKKRRHSFFILLRSSQPLLSSCCCPLLSSCMSVLVVISTSPLQWHLVWHCETGLWSNVKNNFLHEPWYFWSQHPLYLDKNIFVTMSNRLICMASCCSYIWGCSKPLLGFFCSLLLLTCIQEPAEWSWLNIYRPFVRFNSVIRL